ncbi:uncharacterized protein LOC62_01G000526 [Vanrija pseudolonga]|uniref:DUF2264 domain-containing protein n=1 Tax=Vanrija pseudolonga TaxID=143232 RepID=A0AAF0XZP4_9TREE|nr:hypothetical protein LOC62_01G000526 [Vanrija pseudolonga]
MFTPSPAVKAITSNPLRTRDDAVQLLLDLLAPLADAQSAGGARVELFQGGVVFGEIAAQFEGYARALWGLAPALAAEPDHPLLRPLGDRWRAGLDNGTNPAHEEYWGKLRDRDQRCVEIAAVAVAIAIAPDVFWTPLSDEAKTRVAKWITAINDVEIPPNNWRWFRILANVSLKSVGAEYSEAAIEETLEFVESHYNADGFPADGPCDQMIAYDYYATSFAIPFYSLLYTRLAPQDKARISKIWTRTLANIPNVIHLFAPDGASIPFGRSMTYRFATAAFWSALAYATDDEHPLPAPLTWGVVKGLVLRSIRYFTQKESVFARDGSLTIGWTYPSLFMSEQYNSPQSPYWALKTFFVMALPKEHPFWTAEEESIPEVFSENAVVKPWLQTFSHAAGHTFLLTSGQCTNWPMLQTAAKYGKLAYSSAFGFSVVGGQYGLDSAAADSTISICEDDDGEYWQVSRNLTDVSVSDEGVIKSTWKPKPNITITTWLIPPPDKHTPWHTRVHRIESGRGIKFSSGGFAIHSHTGPKHSERHLPVVQSVGTAHGRYEAADKRAAIATSKAGVSAVYDLLGTGEAVVHDMAASTNLVSGRTVFPTVLGHVGAGQTKWVALRVFAQPSAGDLEPQWVEAWNELKPWAGLAEAQKELPFIKDEGKCVVM